MSRSDGLATRLAAGFIGTVVLNLFERIEGRVLGREPTYSPQRIAQRLGLTRNGLPASTRERVGAALRWTYGPALGALLSARYGRWDTFRAGLLVGGTIYVFELVVAPAVGATPRLARWRKSELASLLAHTSVFGIAAVAAFRSLRDPSPR